jgi:hypothetical protein
VYDEPLLILAFRGEAEEAAGKLIRLLDVLEPPRGPELLGQCPSR